MKLLVKLLRSTFEKWAVKYLVGMSGTGLPNGPTQKSVTRPLNIPPSVGGIALQLHHARQQVAQQEDPREAVAIPQVATNTNGEVFPYSESGSPNKGAIPISEKREIFPEVFDWLENIKTKEWEGVKTNEWGSVKTNEWENEGPDFGCHEVRDDQNGL